MLIYWEEARVPVHQYPSPPPTFLGAPGQVYIPPILCQGLDQLVFTEQIIMIVMIAYKQCYYYIV